MRTLLHDKNLTFYVIVQLLGIENGEGGDGFYLFVRILYDCFIKVNSIIIIHAKPAKTPRIVIKLKIGPKMLSLIFPEWKVVNKGVKLKTNVKGIINNRLLRMVESFNVDFVFLLIV